MKTVNYLTVSLLSLTLIFSLGCTATRNQEGTTEYVDDTVITAQVKARILNEPSLKLSEINVETFKGVVQLSGFVPRESNWIMAVEIARGVKGVKSVKNDMRSK
jgi:hyperosmotically inducible protein